MLHTFYMVVNQRKVKITEDIDTPTPEDIAHCIKKSRSDGTESIYFEETFIAALPAVAIHPIAAIINNANALVGQAAVHIQEDDEAPPSEYDSQGNYKHNGKREKYTRVDRVMGEGEKAKLMFATVNLDRLKRNFAFKTNQDPNVPNNRMVKLPRQFETGTDTHRINSVFWEFVIDEFENKQWKHIIQGEERSNGFNGGAHRDWWLCDYTSERINDVKLPPKSDVFKPSLGSQ